ncbi:hypothetical protein EV360DRAFT_69649 [Lentinula raphanica]|nr:hypothetical protein EV360DRAFT_69649 [Lentinula raphanica]
MCSWLKLPLDRKDSSVATHSETELTTARTRPRSSYGLTWISRNRWLKNGKRTTFELPSNDSKPSNLYEYRGREQKGILEERISRTREKYGRLTHFLEGMICSMSTGRVFTLLPRVDKFSHHHVHLEELVQNVPAEDIMGIVLSECVLEKSCSRVTSLETDSLEFDRVRKLYEDHLHRAPHHRNDPQFDPANFSAWIKYAKIEIQSEDFTRTRAIIKLGDFSRRCLFQRCSGWLTLTLRLETQDRQGKPLGRSMNDFSLSGPFNHSKV